MFGLGPELVSPDRIGWWWKRARKIAGIDAKWRLHDLRHWSATVAIGQGHDVRTVAGRLGHANPAMTLRVYAHAFAAADQAVAAGLGDLLKEPAPEAGRMRPIVASSSVAAAGMMRSVTHGAVSILERPVYGIVEAAGLLGLRSDRTRAWLDGYARGGVTYSPVIRREPTGDDVVTWGEFVELGYLREYRRKGVPLQRLRPVIDELRREFDTPYPLATAKPVRLRQGARA